jgi:hypothetical protein
LFGPNAGASELHELLRLLRRVADDADAHGSVAICGRLGVFIRSGDATDERSRRGGCQKNTHTVASRTGSAALLRDQRSRARGGSLSRTRL